MVLSLPILSEGLTHCKLLACVDSRLDVSNDLCSKSSVPLSSSDVHQLQAAEPLPAAVIKQIAKELKDLQEKPEEGIKVCLLTPFAIISCCCLIVLMCFSAAAVFE